VGPKGLELTETGNLLDLPIPTSPGYKATAQWRPFESRSWKPLLEHLKAFVYST
jgi:hypothetical protein